MMTERTRQKQSIIKKRDIFQNGMLAKELNKINKTCRICCFFCIYAIDNSEKYWEKEEWNRSILLIERLEF